MKTAHITFEVIGKSLNFQVWTGSYKTNDSKCLATGSYEACVAAMRLLGVYNPYEVV